MADPPVLLVHGFASSFERNWRDPGWVDLLADARREARGVDLLGHGTSAKPHDPAAYGDMASGITDVLVNGEVIDAVGFSMGAALLLQVAAKRPEAFRRLVVAGVGANLFRPMEGEAIARAMETGGTAQGAPASAGAFVRFAQGSGNDPAALAACMRRPTTPMTPESLTSVALPVLVVLGDRDFAGPAEPLLEALPDAQLVRLAGADHFGTPRDFRFVAAALDFLGADVVSRPVG